MSEPHAKAFDLPGWPTPPRVRDIPGHADSWGWVPVSRDNSQSGVARDELGYLWANGDIAPDFKTPNETNHSPGAVLFQTATGIGLWVHRKSFSYIPSISRLDMEPDSWLPVNEVVAECPAFVRENEILAPAVEGRGGNEHPDALDDQGDVPERHRDAGPEH